MFPWNESVLIQNEYNGANVKVINTNAGNNRAIVFFSGNGLYYPNTEQTFIQAIVKNDRYEWENIAQSHLIRNEYAKIIFVRDIYKQWYVTGVSATVNSISHVIDYMRQLTEGMAVTTCGNSGGGYAAMIVGVAIHADVIFSFSGQFDLTDQIGGGPLLKKYAEDTNKNQYFRVKDFIGTDDDSWSKIVHFYPARCQWDIQQMKCVANKGLIVFPMDEEIHGKTIKGDCYEYILIKSLEQITSLRKVFGDIISQQEFEQRVVPVEKRVGFAVKDAGRSVKRALKKIVKKEKSQ